MNATNQTDTRDDLQAYRQVNDTNLIAHQPPIEIYAGLIEQGRHVYLAVMRAAALSESCEATYVAAETARRETHLARYQAFGDAIKAAMQPLE